MTDTELVDTVRRLLADATPGPWEVYTTSDAEDVVVEQGRKLFGVVARPNYGHDDYGRADARLIAAAPTLLARLADLVEQRQVPALSDDLRVELAATVVTYQRLGYEALATELLDLILALAPTEAE